MFVFVLLLDLLHDCCICYCFFFFKQKTAYEMRISDWSSDVCSSDLYRAFATERLFRPAGVTSAFLEFDGAGTQIGGSLIYMTLDDWGRMGRLLLDGTGADGAQVIALDWLAFMKAPSPRDPEYGGQT